MMARVIATERRYGGGPEMTAEERRDQIIETTHVLRKLWVASPDLRLIQLLYNTRPSGSVDFGTRDAELLAGLTLAIKDKHWQWIRSTVVRDSEKQTAENVHLREEVQSLRDERAGFIARATAAIEAASGTSDRILREVMLTIPEHHQPKALEGLGAAINKWAQELLDAGKKADTERAVLAAESATHKPGAC